MNQYNGLVSLQHVQTDAALPMKYVTLMHFCLRTCLQPWYIFRSNCQHVLHSQWSIRLMLEATACIHFKLQTTYIFSRPKYSRQTRQTICNETCLPYMVTLCNDIYIIQLAKIKPECWCHWNSINLVIDVFGTGNIKHIVNKYSCQYS